jgi:hypothetical protein
MVRVNRRRRWEARIGAEGWEKSENLLYPMAENRRVIRDSFEL